MVMDIWSKLGFSEGEGRVYEAIMNTEHATLQYIHEQTGIERRNVYDIINKLIHKGLVSYIDENKHKVYRVTNPRKLFDYFEREKEQIEDRQKTVMDELPKLQRMYESNKPKLDAKIYRGKEGLRAIFDELLEYDDIWFIGGNWGMKKYLGQRWCENWDRKRVEKKIKWHDIITQPSAFLSEPMSNKLKFYEAKYLPEEFSSPNVFGMTREFVVNLYWGDPLFAVVIENEQVAKNYITHFEYLWKTLGQPVRVHYGFDGIVRMHESTYCLKKGEEYFYLGIPAKQPKHYHEKWKNDHLRRIKAGIKCRLLFAKNTSPKIMENRNSYSGCDARYMPFEMDSPTWIMGYRDVTGIVMIGKKPVTIEIENKEISKSFRQYFEAVWKMSKPFKKRKR
jgi:predicted transcriptional regulator